MKKLLFYLSVIFYLTSINSSAEDWKIFHKPIKIKKLEIVNNSLWGVTLEGLARIYKSTGDRYYYHAFNCQLPFGKYNFYDSTRVSIVDHAGIIWLSHSKSSDYAVSGFNPMNGISINFTKDELKESCWLQSETNISAIAVDQDNIKWFGTTKGKLLKYDGDDFVCDDPCPLDSFPINNMIFDIENKLWFGYGKLYKYDKGHVTEYPLDPDITQKKYIKSITTDGQGNVWYSFETWNGSKAFGLYKFDGKDHEKWNTDNTPALNSNYARYLFFDSKDNLWFVSDDIISFDGTEFTRFDLDDTGIDKENLLKFQCSFTEDDNSNIWFTCGYDILFFDGTKFKKIPSEDLMFPTDKEIQDLEVDDNGKAYLTQEYYDTTEHFFGAIITEKKESNELLIISGENIRKAVADSHLDFMDSDSKGNIWIGGGKTLVRYNGYGFHYIETGLYEGQPDPFDSYREGITELKVDQYDNVWFTGNYSYSSTWPISEYGSKGNGILKYDGNDITSYLIDPNIPYFYFATDGSVWTKPYKSKNGVPKFFNLFRIKDDKVYEIDVGKPNYQYSLRAIDNANNLWLSSERYGLMKTKNDGHLLIYDSKIYDIPSIDFSYIEVDDQNRVWLICQIDESRGAHIVTIFDNDTATNLDGNSDTLFTKKIESIDFDSKGNCWIVADEEINGVPLYKVTKSFEVEKITPENSDIPGYEINHLEIDSDDNIWMDCNLGLAIYNEENVIIGVDENNRELKMSLHPNPFSQSTIINYELREAGYISLELFDMLGNKIATLVDDWQEAGRHNYELRISNYELNSGMYMVRMMSGDGVVTEKVVFVE